jgi:hypothetical protein
VSLPRTSPRCRSAHLTRTTQVRYRVGRDLLREVRASQAPTILIPGSGSPAKIDHVPRFDLIPEPTADGRIVFRVRPGGPGEWLRRLIRRLVPAHERR